MAPTRQRRDLTLEAVLGLGEGLGQLLRPGAVVLLHGEMGAGKTTLTRAVAQGLGVLRADRVCSPTFNICVHHPGPVPLIHIDLFRLAPDGDASGAPASFEALGLQELLDQTAETDDNFCGEASAAVVIVEWPALARLHTAGALEIELTRPAGQLVSRDLRAWATGPGYDDLLAAWLGSPTSAA